MKEKINALLNGGAENHIYPFLWPDEDHPENIPDEIDAIFRSGCGGLCLEARPFEKFGQEEWWHTVKTVLDEAKKRDMKVWILDDKHFPTGYANGCIEKKYPELRRRWLYEHHFDMYGPAKDCAVRLPDENEYERPLCACAYRRSGKDEELCGEPLVFTLKENAGFLQFDLPEGFWRVFIVCESTSPRRGHGWYIDMLSRESAAVLIEAVYEEHYKHLSEYFGDPLTGFFSDEPSFSAQHTERWGSDPGFYFGSVGVPGMSLPWNVTVEERMTSDGYESILPLTPLLWYDNEDLAPELRLFYMNAVTTLWQENFSYAVGNWCRSHGIIYTGHIIEDNNAHSRLSSSAGHYFRGLSGQDTSGIDVVLIQVVPGMSDHFTAAAIAGGHANGPFFHYTLAQLAASLSRIEPRMQGRAMCELFGAFGWAESVPFMKWMADFLLIRGINRFVPHAFSVKHPFDDCPPHFYAHGCNPQYDGFSVLMRYINKVSTLLDGAVRQTPGAIFYYAENEWMSGKDFTYGDNTGRALFDAHIDYDIIPLDHLEKAEIKDGKLYTNGIPHSFLAIPEAKHYCKKLIDTVRRLTDAGFPVFTVTEKNFGNILGEGVPVGRLSEAVLSRGLAHDYLIPSSKLRVTELRTENAAMFFLFNEEPVEDADALLTLPVTGEYTELRLLNDEVTGGCTEDGKLRVRLKKGESVIFVFDGEKSAYPIKREIASVRAPEFSWDISLLCAGEDTEYREYKKGSPLINVTSLDENPDFSGYIKYQTTFVSDGTDRVLDLGEVGFTAEVTLNGDRYPVRIHAPYTWDISRSVRDGKNELVVVAANTLSNRLPDDLSTFMPLSPSGVTGPVLLAK